MHKAKSNQKSIHNHLQGADVGQKLTKGRPQDREKERGGRGGETSQPLGRQFNQICYKTVKVCDSDRKQDSKSQQAGPRERSICMPSPAPAPAPGSDCIMQKALIGFAYKNLEETERKIQRTMHQYQCNNINVWRSDERLPIQRSAI